MSIITGRTPNLKLNLAAFDVSNWEPLMRENLYIIDATVSQFIQNNKIVGSWHNSTQYKPGQVAVDAEDGTLWECAVTHTSAATGTFAEDRAGAASTYWGPHSVAVGSTEGLAVTPDDFGADPEFPEQDATSAVRNALNEALLRGVPLQLDRMFIVSEALFADLTNHDTLAIRGNGGLHCIADLAGNAILRVTCAPEVIHVIANIDNNATRDFGGQGDATACCKLTIEDNALEPGRFARIISEDGVEPGDTCRKGEVVYIKEVVGDSVYLASRLNDSYGTSPRLALYRANKKVHIREISITNDWDTLISDGWKNIGIRLEGLISPIIQLVTSKDISLSAIRVQGCVSAKISGCGFLRGYNDNAASGITGYGVDDRCSEYTQVLGCHGSDLRHLYTTNRVTSDITNPWTYGTTRNCTVNDTQAAACSSSPFDTHDSSVNVSFIGCRSNTVYKGPDVAWGGFQLRGRKHKVLACEHTGSGVGILIDTDNQAQILGPADKHTIEGFIYDGDNYAVRATSGLESYYVWAHIADLQARTSYKFGVVRLDRAQVSVEGWRLVNYSDQDERIMFDLRGEARVEGTDVICDFSTGYSNSPSTQDGFVIGYQNGNNNIRLDYVQVKAGLSIWDLIAYIGDSTPNFIETALYVDADKQPVSDEGIRLVGTSSDTRLLIIVNKGRDGTTSYRERPLTGANNELGLRGCFAPSVVRSLVVTTSDVSINSLLNPPYQGQLLTIVNSPSSTHDLLLKNTPGNRISIGADVTLAPGQGLVLAWVGSTWVSASVSVAVDPGTGVTDHGALSGLSDDDHTQYHTDARANTWLGTKSLGALGNVPAIGTAKQALRVNNAADDHEYRMPMWDTPEYNIGKIAPDTHDADISGAGLSDTATVSVYPKTGSANNTALRMFAGVDKGRFASFIDHAFKVIARISESAGGLFEFRIFGSGGAAVTSYLGSSFHVFGGDSGNRNASNQVTVIGGIYADSYDGPTPLADYTQPILIGQVRLWDDGTKLRAKRGSDPSGALDGSALW